MNQMVGKDSDGNQFMAVVLEPGNLHKLQNSLLPIEIHVEDMFPDGIPKKLRLIIGYTNTPEADAKVLSEKAEVVIDEREPKKATRRPHCPECKSTIEEMGMMRNESPITVIFCVMCGCVLGVMPRS